VVHRLRGRHQEGYAASGGTRAASREYEKDGEKHRIVDIRTKSILKLDRAKRHTEAVPQEADAHGRSFGCALLRVRPAVRETGWRDASDWGRVADGTG